MCGVGVVAWVVFAGEAIVICVFGAEKYKLFHVKKNINKSFAIL